MPSAVCVGQDICLHASGGPTIGEYQWGVEEFAHFVNGDTGPNVTIHIDAPGEIIVGVHKGDCNGSATLVAHQPSIVGPTYIGVNAPAVFTVQSADGQSSYVQVFWEVVDGVSLVQVTSSMQTRHFELTALQNTGDVTLRATVDVGSGSTCTATTTVHILQYDEVNIRWTAFIPCEAVPNPNPFVPFVAYGGDNRTFLCGASSYRCRMDLNTRVSDNFGITTFPIYLPSNPTPFGQSRAYNQGGAEQVAGACNWAIIGPPVGAMTLTSPPALHQIKILSRPVHNRLVFEFRLSAPNPFEPIACPIGYHLRFGLEQVIDPDIGAQSATYLMTPLGQIPGTCTEFPAHEVYFTGQPVFQYDPVPIIGNDPTHVCFQLQFPERTLTFQTSP